jgi:RHS repeat-associated protein
MIGETHQINRYSGYRHLQVSLCQADIPRATMIITSAAFSNDADYTRVKGVLGGVSMIYIAGIYEWQAGAATKYYDGGAMRRSSYTSGNGIFYILKDQLGSTSVVVSQSGSMQATNYYYPYGGNRGGSAFSELTTKRFTGQYHEVSLSGSEGLSYYGARWYDPQLGRFISADTIVPSPSSPQALNRFTYVNDNPINHTDFTGHDCDDGPQTYALCYGNGRGSKAVWAAANTPNGSWTYSQVRTWRLPNGHFNAVAYTLSEMRRNSRSNEVKQMQFLNRGEPLAYKLAAMRVWIDKVNYTHVWDHKPKVQDLTGNFGRASPDWQEVGSEQYRFDTWSNIHYGYVGKAAGFDTDTLLSGASMAQAKNEIVRNHHLPPYYPHGNLLQDFDPPEDRSTILLGARLWETFGAKGIDPTEEQFVDALRATPGLNRHDSNGTQP